MLKNQNDESLILWFDQITIDDVLQVGGKNTSHREMVRELGPKGIKVPNGFAVTASAYRHFLSQCGLADRIHRKLSGWQEGDVKELAKRGINIRQMTNRY